MVCQILLHTGGHGISYLRYIRFGEMCLLISRGVLKGDNLHSYPSSRSTHCAPSKHGSLTHHKRVSHSRPEKSMGQEQLKSFQVIWHDPLFRHGSSCAPTNPDGWIRKTYISPDVTTELPRGLSCELAAQKDLQPEERKQT